MERLFDLAENQADLRPDSTMLAAKVNGVWQTCSCKSVVHEAQEFAAGLLTLNICDEVLKPERQEKIALVSGNRPEWLIADLAVQQTGAVLVPIYPTISLHEFAFILNQSEVRILILSDEELYLRFLPAFKDIPTLQEVISFDEIKGVKHWKTLKGTSASEHQRLTLRQRINRETLCTIIYTSGTTGEPKGVMLTHANIVSNIMDCMPIFHFMNVDDKSLSFLPLNHIFEKMISYICIHTGISIYYAESLDTIGDDLREVRPMVFTCVPRLLEKVYEKIVAKGRAQSGYKKWLFFWSLKLAKQYRLQEKGNLGYRLKLKIANTLVFQKWRDALGGNIKAVISGSAPLSVQLNRIFCAAGIPIMEGYGLTETSPVVSVNRLEKKDRRIGTVGPLINNVSVKIADDGEILCKGANIMKGYYKKPEATAESLKDGWFYTGDIGEMVEGRFLKITDRKKEMFKTSGGKYVAPQPIENKFKESRFISQIMIFGPDRKFVSALIVPDFKNVFDYLKFQFPNITDDPQAMVIEPTVKGLFQKILEKYNVEFGHVEQIKKFTLLADEWTIENGILTPKLSLRRKVISERFKKEVDAMYQ